MKLVLGIARTPDEMFLHTHHVLTVEEDINAAATLARLYLKKILAERLDHSWKDREYFEAVGSMEGPCYQCGKGFDWCECSR